jgi:hypothetical protein
VNGPAETRIVMDEPFVARPDGLVPVTVPFGSVLLLTGNSRATANPFMVSAVVAALTESPATTGIAEYRPANSHQPPSPSPMPSAMISAMTPSRGLNSQRCRNGSRPPRYRPPSSRCTTSVCDPTLPVSNPSIRNSLAGAGMASCLPRSPGLVWPLPSASAELRAHHPLVAAGVSRFSHGASARP